MITFVAANTLAGNDTRNIDASVTVAISLDDDFDPHLVIQLLTEVAADAANILHEIAHPDAPEHDPRG